MRIKAIVIKKTRTNEYDQIVTCYTEDYGTVRALARGILRPKSLQALQLDDLNLVEFEMIEGRALPIIASAQVLESFSNLRTGLPRLAAAQFFVEVLDKISFENERDPELWELLNEMLTSLNSAPSGELMATFRSYQNRFLDVLGYAPRTEHCVVCSGAVMNGHEKMIALSPELGGALCADCFLVSKQGLLFDKHELLNNKGLSGQALDTFFEYVIGKKLSSLTLLYQVAKP
ncbi:MAG TPA: DNA repair protein RecO [Candidatus Paceibacterota bacterium]|nr:DNA repair protein RecO [Candidatus Paceibacterota bacterium]